MADVALRNQAGNPLCAPLMALLLAEPEGASEYELLQRLDDWMPDFGDVAKDADRLLFCRHFLFMNALWRIEPELSRAGWHVDPSPLGVRLVPAAEARHTLPAATADAALREYYLDWSQLTSTTGDEVRALLAGFWRRLRARDQRAQALAELGLSESATEAEIRDRYRRLAARHHPDRGGDAALFRRIRRAWEVLQCATQRRASS